MGTPVAKLIEEGVREYVSGRIPEALALFQEVLEQDPKNNQAKTYLDLVRSTHPNAVAAPRPVSVEAPPESSSPPAQAPPPPAAQAHAPPLVAVAPVAPPPQPAAHRPAAAPVPAAVAEAAPSVPAVAQEVQAPAPAAPARTFVSVPSPPVPPDQRFFEMPAPVHAAPAAAPEALLVPETVLEPETVPETPARRPRKDLSALLEPYFAQAAEPGPPRPPEPAAAPPPTAVRGAEPPVRPSEPDPFAGAPAVAASGDAGIDYAPSPWDDGPATGATIVLSDETSGGLDLAAVAEKSDLRPLVPQGNTQAPAPAGGPPTDVDLWLKAAKELFALGDFTGSLELIEKILTVDPDHGEARDYLRQNEATLVSMYESKLGPLHATPRLAIKPEEVMWLNLDHRAGFLLAQIDGTVDYEGLFAVSGLPRLDTARILANLIADGVVKS